MPGCPTLISRGVQFSAQQRCLEISRRFPNSLKLHSVHSGTFPNVLPSLLHTATTQLNEKQQKRPQLSTQRSLDFPWAAYDTHVLLQCNVRQVPLWTVFLALLATEVRPGRESGVCGQAWRVAGGKRGAHSPGASPAICSEALACFPPMSLIELPLTRIATSMTRPLLFPFVLQVHEVGMVLLDGCRGLDQSQPWSLWFTAGG